MIRFSEADFPYRFSDAKTALCLDCNILVANIETYPETALHRWCDSQEDYDLGNKLANLLLWEILNRYLDNLENLPYELHIQNGEIRIIVNGETDRSDENAGRFLAIAGWLAGFLNDGIGDTEE